MHKPIEDGLEDLLSGRGTEQSKLLREHLAVCTECREEFAPLEEQMREINSLLHTLRPAEACDPAPGFYARVMDRIETQTPTSFWSVFLEPVFARRLVYASLALFLVLTSAMWRTGDTGTILNESNPVSLLAAEELPQANGADPRHDREVVLATFVSYGGDQGGGLQMSSD